MENLYLGITFGLLASIIWGAADFSGGFASKKLKPIHVVFFSQIFGAVFLSLVVILNSETISRNSIIYAVLAGISGAFGIVYLYTTLANEKMGIAAPLIAIFSTSLPIAYSFVTEGIPAFTQILGFIFALIAVFMMVYDPEYSISISNTSMRNALLAGLGIGLFFIFIDAASNNSVYLPVIVARISSMVVLFIMIKSKNQRIELPNENKLFVVVIVVIAGIFDSLGNVLFVLSAQSGRLDIAVVISGFYPLWTMLFAFLLIKERINLLQGFGGIIAVLSIILITY